MPAPRGPGILPGAFQPKLPCFPHPERRAGSGAKEECPTFDLRPPTFDVRRSNVRRSTFTSPPILRLASPSPAHACSLHASDGTDGGNCIREIHGLPGAPRVVALGGDFRLRCGGAPDAGGGSRGGGRLCRKLSAIRRWTPTGGSTAISCAAGCLPTRRRACAWRRSSIRGSGRNVLIPWSRLLHGARNFSSQTFRSFLRRDSTSARTRCSSSLLPAPLKSSGSRRAADSMII